MKNEMIVALFADSVTDQGIKDIIAKHDPSVVLDMRNEVEFKAARKVRTEMNKLIENIDRIGIDASSQVTQMRSDLKARVESAYSPTVKPYMIEDQKRKDEKKRVAEEKKSREAEQKAKIDEIKGASNRAMHLPIDDLEDILQSVCDVDLDWFDEEYRGGAQIAKEVSIGQLNDAFKYLSEKEHSRKAAEIKEAEIADKDDEIEALKKQLAALKPKEPEPKSFWSSAERAEIKICDAHLIIDLFGEEESKGLFEDIDGGKYTVEVTARRKDLLN